jgi:diguanylate cyclase (GGDEF)-like protein/PAS domain S-box-containing protein
MTPTPHRLPDDTRAGDHVFDLVDDPFLSATQKLEQGRANLAETATYSGTWQWDASSDVFDVSPALLFALPTLDLGYQREELLDTGRGTALPASVAAALPGELAKALALATGEDRLALALMLGSAWAHRAGFEINHGSGDDTAVVRHVGAVVTDTGGVALGMVGVLTVQPDDQASDPNGDLETARRYRQLMRVLPSGVIIHQDGIIVDANPSILELVGLTSAEQLTGRSIMEMIVPEGRRRLMERVIAMSKPGAIAPPEEEEVLLPDGTRIPVEIVSIRTTWRGRPAGQAVITDIRERKAILARLTHDATHDALTGLGTRRLIVDEIQTRMADRLPFNVLFVDLDRFKDVNDSFGHAVGDDLLRQTVSRLRKVAACHPGTFVGRLSGDEFILLAPAHENATDLARNICQALAVPYPVGTVQVVITSSVGVAYADPDTYGDTQPLDLIRDADVAMYRAKEHGRNQWITFDETMRRSLQRRVTMTEYLRQAVEDPAGHGMHLIYQPIVCTSDGRPQAVETLIRWEEPALGRAFPDEFIPLAEETGFIVPLGYWILMTACHQLATWRAAHPELARLKIAVNLSPRQLNDPALLDTVRATLDTVGLPAGALCLEITETALADDVETATRTVTALHALGVSLSIDDFGTGYSSLSYLRNLPVSELKVDRSFVSGIGTASDEAAHAGAGSGAAVRDETICKSVISMAHALGLQVVAEGIETQEQQDCLEGLKCDFIQGYYKCRPVPAQEALAYLLAAGH